MKILTIKRNQIKKLVPILFIVSFIISSCRGSSRELITAPTIREIQSCSHISPYNGKRVIGVKGVVTHKFSNGFSMQSIIADSLQCSSEAIFVMTDAYPKVFPGQLVRVDGNILEYFPGTGEDHNLSRTELHDPSIVVTKEDVALP
jgi:predicted extracellular nuclease